LKTLNFQTTKSISILGEALMEGATQAITVSVIVAGMIPIFLSAGVDSEVIGRRC
jgi:Cu/Ag efflux pump CusA